MVVHYWLSNKCCTKIMLHSHIKLISGVIVHWVSAPIILCNEVADFLKHDEQSPPGPAHSSGSMAQWLVPSCDVNDICGAIYYCLIAILPWENSLLPLTMSPLPCRLLPHLSLRCSAVLPSTNLSSPYCFLHIPVSVWNGSKHSTTQQGSHMLHVP